MRKMSPEGKNIDSHFRGNDTTLRLLRRRLRLLLAMTVTDYGSPGKA